METTSGTVVNIDWFILVESLVPRRCYQQIHNYIDRYNVQNCLAFTLHWPQIPATSLNNKKKSIFKYTSLIIVYNRRNSIFTAMNKSHGPLDFSTQPANGSFHAAPITEGLTMTTGKSWASCSSRVSATHFVYVNVFGLSAMSLLVANLIQSSSIHPNRFRIFCGSVLDG